MNKVITFIRLTITTTICLMLMTSCSDDNNSASSILTTPVAYFEALNVSYGDDDEQVFDIYLPENRTIATKVMVLVHGGGWSEGDKTDMDLIRDFIRQDMPNTAIVNINYRLADANNSPYPMQINDIGAVLDYLKTNQNELIISDDFGLLGVSAGAHLSMLYSYAFDFDNDVKMVASIVGPTNFTDPAYLNTDIPELQEYIDLYGIDPTTDYLEEVSPYHQVTAAAPPTILFYGGQDPLIPTSQGILMEEKLASLSVTHQFTLYPNAGHGWLGPELLDTWVKLTAFSQLHLEN